MMMYRLRSVLSSACRLVLKTDFSLSAQTTNRSISPFSTIATGILVVCAVIVTALVVRQQFFPPQPEAAVPETRELEEVEWTRVVGEAGNPGTATVTIVEFYDFECPFCKQGLPALEHVTEVFGNEVEVIRRHLPLPIHPAAVPAAVAAECAGTQGQFETYHALLFAKQDSLASGTWSKWAEEVGVEDLPAFETCVEEQQPLGKIEADAALAQDLGIRGTPNYIINGTVYPGAQTPEGLEEIVREIAG